MTKTTREILRPFIIKARDRFETARRYDDAIKLAEGRMWLRLAKLAAREQVGA